jgi:hypothetical protein
MFNDEKFTTFIWIKVHGTATNNIGKHIPYVVFVEECSLLGRYAV